MVQIAHNVVIGRNSEITTGMIIGGSTRIGEMCWTGLNSTLKDNIRLGDNVLVAAGAVVIRDVPDKRHSGGSSSTFDPRQGEDRYAICNGRTKKYR